VASIPPILGITTSITTIAGARARALDRGVTVRCVAHHLDVYVL
jgi:hypothetical protein